MPRPQHGKRALRRIRPMGNSAETVHMITIRVPHDWDRMPKFPAGSLNRIALRDQVNRVLVERSLDLRVAEARSVAERKILGDYYLVHRFQRHVVIRDHVDLHEFAQEIGVSCSPADNGQY